MARILLGWELGANRGHIERLMPVALRLLNAGHDVAVALQQIDSAGIERDLRLSLWQAPVWPRLLVNVIQDYSRKSATMGDILGQLGLDRPGCLAAMISAWDAIFAASRPDVVIGDFAPALLAAANGRIASIAVGDFFTVPPSQIATFPNLTGNPTAYDEEELLDLVDADLASVGRAPLPGLPALFAASEAIVGNFAELDPYHDVRIDRYSAPSVKLPYADGEGGGGEEIFVTSFGRVGAHHPTWAGLAGTKRRVRVYIGDPTREHLATFERFGFIYEPKPLPFPLIAQRSKLALSYGGNGFTSACLIAALPHMIIPYDLEKQLTASAIARLGFGMAQPLSDVSSNGLTRALDQLADNSAVAARLRAAAPSFKAQMAFSSADAIIDAVDRLLG